MTPARFTAAAHRSAAGVFRLSGSPAQRSFASTLDTWAANADRRADEAEALGQPVAVKALETAAEALRGLSQ